MKIRTRAVLILALPAAGLAAAAALLSGLNLVRMQERLELELFRYRTSLVASAFSAENEHLSSNVRDWTNWDVLDDFTRQPGNEDFPRESITPLALEGLGIEAIVILDDQQRVLAGLTRGPDGEPVPALLTALVQEIAPVVRGADAARAARWTGVLPFEDGPVVVSAAWIRRSDGSGSGRSVLLMAHRLDARFLAALGDRANARLSISAAAPDDLPPPSKSLP